MPAARRSVGASARANPGAESAGGRRTADGADDQQPSAQSDQPRRLILSNLAFEVGDEVEQETNQAEGGFGAIEGVQAEAVSAKVLLEFLDV